MKAYGSEFFFHRVLIKLTVTVSTKWTLVFDQGSICGKQGLRHSLMTPAALLLQSIFCVFFLFVFGQISSLEAMHYGDVIIMHGLVGEESWPKFLSLNNDFQVS